MVAYRRVYDSRHLQADCQEPGSLRNPTLDNRVWATFTYFSAQRSFYRGAYYRLLRLVLVV